MSLRMQPDSRHRVMGDAIVMVKEAARKGTTLSVNAEAQRLLHDHPACLMTLEQLQYKITRLALLERVSIQLG